MQPFLYFLLVLICPLGMGLMMWLMMRGGGHRKNDDGAAERELARLRTEIATLQPATAAFDERHPGSGPSV